MWSPLIFGLTFIAVAIAIFVLINAVQEAMNVYYNYGKHRHMLSENMTLHREFKRAAEYSEVAAEYYKDALNDIKLSKKLF